MVSVRPYIISELQITLYNTYLSLLSFSLLYIETSNMGKEAGE